LPLSPPTSLLSLSLSKKELPKYFKESPKPLILLPYIIAHRAAQHSCNQGVTNRYLFMLQLLEKRFISNCNINKYAHGILVTVVLGCTLDVGRFYNGENVAKFKYFGTTLTNQNDNHEIKSRLNSGNPSYHSVQNVSSSRLISKNVKIKIYKTVILPVVLYGCEVWSFTLREEHGLRVFENSVEEDIWT
jgi:hypothetical protein